MKEKVRAILMFKGSIVDVCNVKGCPSALRLPVESYHEITKVDPNETATLYQMVFTFTEILDKDSGGTRNARYDFAGIE